MWHNNNAMDRMIILLRLRGRIYWLAERGVINSFPSFFGSLDRQECTDCLSDKDLYYLGSPIICIYNLHIHPSIHPSIHPLMGHWRVMGKWHYMKAKESKDIKAKSKRPKLSATFFMVPSGRPRMNNNSWIRTWPPPWYLIELCPKRVHV